MDALRPALWPASRPATGALLGARGAAVQAAVRRWARRATAGAALFPWADLLCQLLFVATAAALLWPALTHGAIRWQDDTKYFYFPLLSDLAAALKQGRLPLWEPALFGGYPLFADGESGMLYPPHLLLLRLLDPPAALVAIRLVRFFFAGSFTFAFLRATGARRTAATVAGLVFMSSGFVVGQVVHENLDSGMVWLPLVLWGIEMAVRQRPGTPGFRRRRYTYACMAGVALAMQTLAVHVQVCVFTVLLAGPYLVWRVLWRDTVGAGLPGRLIIGAGIGMLLGAVGAGLSAAQMLPLLDLAGRSARGHGIDLSAATINSVTPFQLLTVVFPHLLKRPGGTAMTYWVEWEVAIYVGLPALLLAALAVALRRDRYSVFFGLAAALSLTLSTGRYGPPWVVTVTQDLLGAHGLRSPGRFAFLWCFSAAALAGLGMDWLERRASLPRSRPGVVARIGQLWVVVVFGAMAGVCGGLLLAARQAHQWLRDHPAEVQAWLSAHYLRYDQTQQARLKVSAEDVYRGLVTALNPHNPATIVWALSIVAGYALLVAWMGRASAARHALPALRTVTVVVIAVPLLAAASQAHPEAAVAAIEPHAPAALYLRDQLAPPGVPADKRPLERVYTSQPVYLGHTDVEPNVLLPLGVQEAGGYSSLSSTVNLAYGWVAETSQGRMLDVWNARYLLWPNGPDPLPSYELTSFHPLRPILAGSGWNTGASGAFRVPDVPAENVRIIATLRDAWDVPAGTVVAWVTATAADGTTQRWPLRMGMELADATAPPAPLADGETADGPRPLPIFSWQEDGADGNPYNVWLYYVKLPLDQVRTIRRLTVQTVPLASPVATLRVHGLGVGQPDWQVDNLLWSDRERYTLVFEDQDIQVYRNDTVLPRAYLVPLAVGEPAYLHLKEMSEREFDPERMLLIDVPVPPDGDTGSATGAAGGSAAPLEGPSEAVGAGSWLARPSTPPGDGDATDGADGADAASAAPEVPLGEAPRLVTASDDGRSSTAPAGTVTLTRYDGNVVRADVNVAPQAGAWLFLSDTFDPSWHAYVDGTPMTVHLANAMFRAVAVPVGHHLVELRYEPEPLRVGATVSLAAGVVVLLFLCGGLWWQVREHREAQHRASAGALAL